MTTMYSQASKQYRINPLANIAGLLALTIPALVSFDPWTPICALALGMTVFFIAARPSAGKWLKTAGPFLLLSAGLGFVNLLFTPDEGSKVLLSAGPVAISEHSIRRALSVGSRSLTLTALCTLAAHAMSPFLLVHALMQHFKLPPVAGFSLFAGLNALPRLGEDIRHMERIRLARAAGRSRPVSERFALPVVLLASAIRHAERSSLSMAARGLEAAKNRSFAVKSEFRPRDTAFILSCALAAVVTLTASALFSWFRFDLG